MDIDTNFSSFCATELKLRPIFYIFYGNVTLASAILHNSNCPRVRTSHPPEFNIERLYLNNQKRKNFNKHFEVRVILMISLPDYYTCFVLPWFELHDNLLTK